MRDPIEPFRSKQEPKISLETFGEPFGVDKSTVKRWQDNGVPAERVLDIERQWGISRHDLRPDLYPREGRAA